MKGKDYQKDVFEPVNAWASRHFIGNFLTFHQEWTSAHRAKSSQGFVEKNFPNSWGKDVWLRNFHDLTL